MPFVMCTKQLARAMGRAGLAGLSPVCSIETDSKLGNWCAKLFTFRRKKYVLFGSESTLLMLLVPLSPSNTLFQRFRYEMGRELLRLGVEPDRIEKELHSQEHLVQAPNTNRSLMGSVNDLASHCPYYLERYTRISEHALRKVQEKLNSTPHCNREHVFADAYVKELFQAQNANPKVIR